MVTKVFLITKKEAVGAIDAARIKADEVIWLERGEKDFATLLDDPAEKIIGIDPGSIGWNFPRKIIAETPRLHGICTRSAWADYLDLQLCAERGIAVCNTPAANSRSVAEHAIWQMLSLARKLPLQFADKFKVKHDHEHMHVEIDNKVMGIIGLGNIGEKIAAMGRGLGMEVVYWSKSGKDAPYKKLALEELLRTADFIFNCTEICAATENLLHPELLGLMKPDAYFISVLGGMGWGVEDSQFLIRMVKTGRLAGYSIENKHHKDFRVGGVRGNVFIPGHYAYFTHEMFARVNTMWVEAINGLLCHQPVYRVV